MEISVDDISLLICQKNHDEECCSCDKLEELLAQLGIPILSCDDTPPPVEKKEKKRPPMVTRGNSNAATTTQNGTMPSTSAVGHESTFNGTSNSGNFVARSWARISRRKNKKKNPPIPEDEHQVHVDQPQSSQNVYSSFHENQENMIIPTQLATTAVEFSPDRKSIVNRGMDKLRRSFRKSFHRSNKDRGLTNSEVRDGPSSSTSSPASSSKNYQQDETAVRSGSCSFNVKYLGSCEVYESRGMHVCEGALQHLRAKKRVTKAILYISGDGLRVVDQENNRGLIVDQTIEKVSFCSPDRHNDKGFAYICRDGATRRWMCHGFMAVKESGERLSHAVGCAFAICLEKKKKREQEVATFAAQQANQILSSKPLPSSSSNGGLNGTPSNSFARANAAYSSFRKATITERKQDPQSAILNEPPPTLNPKAQLEESVIKPRPAPNPSLFERQGSFKAPGAATNAANFRRFNSLRSDLMPIQFNSPRTLHNEPIYEGDEWPETGSGLGNGYGTMPTSTSLQFNHLLEGNKENGHGSANAVIANGLTNQGWQESPVKKLLYADTSSNYAYPPGNGSIDSGPLSNRSSKADEWLEQTFKATLNLGSSSNSTQYAVPPSTTQYAYPPSTHYAVPPISSTFSHDSISQLGSTSARSQLIPHSLSSDSTGIASANFGYLSGPPPSMPPPPLPPTMILKSPEKSVLDHVSGNTIRSASPMSPTSSSTSRTPPRKSSSARKSIEYQILEEVDAPLSPPRNTPVPGQAQLASKEVDVFGQPVFAPSSSSTTPKPENQATPPIAKPEDPFDVKWSTLVLQNATSTAQKPTTNPFSNESTPVNV